MKKRKRAVVAIVVAVAMLMILLLLTCINHRIRLTKEAELRRPLGQMVEVNGHQMSVYLTEEGQTTLVFLSGGGTCCPILDFKSLYSLLCGDYRIAVVEKFGYGFSDVLDVERDMDSILADTRAALMAAGLNPPYVLCPHSMSGLEALYWAQKYPGEVSAIIGLDMAVPAYYADMKISLSLLRAAGWAASVGITRLIPGLAESDAILHGSLSDREKAIYRAVFYSRTATVTMINETASVKENAKKVESAGVPQIPMLLFISDGSGGTGFDRETWRQIQIAYIAQVPGGKYITLDCPHYVHNYAYDVISENICAFLSDSSCKKR